MARFYVGNIPFSATEDELKAFFAGFDVTNPKIVIDHQTKKPRGFAFVDILKGDAKAVIGLDGKEWGGRTVRVSEAHDKPKGAPRASSERSHKGRSQDGASFGWDE